MIAEKMKPFVQNNSAIRMMFEEGNCLRAKYGADKVYDFSLGNPSVPAPDCVREAIIDLVNNEEPTVLHGYMSNAGFEDVRETIAQSLNRRFETAFSAHNLIMTVGAASGLNVILKTILNPGEEVIVFAPYFLEYGAYVRNYDGKLVEISPDTATFQPNLKEFEEKVTPKTRAVIVNTPHNPTGVVYSEETIKKLAEILEAKQKEFGTVIYLISDEPYRELAYDGVALEFQQGALEAVADKAIERNIGARGLRAVMEGMLTKVMYDIPSDPTITKVTITADCVNGAEPVVERDPEKVARKAKLKTGTAEKQTAPAS